ncbi:hypothetical protein ID866_10605 [Astraeus odoratus]|nr:hypothetical protein ID866_10605 [Astraeus odoratus]
MSTATIRQALPMQIEQAKAKATDNLWKKVKEDCVKERAAERRQKHKEEEQRVQAEAEQKAQKEAEGQMEEGGGGEGWSWSKAAGGVTWKWRRTEAKEDNGEDDEEDDEDDGKGDFAVLLALVQEHRDVLSTLMMTLSMLLKEFKGYHHDYEATTKGKEKAAEVLEELSESSDKEEQIEGKGSKNGDGDGDVKMGAAPLASAT